MADNARGVTVVWTVHNVAPHDARQPRLAAFLWAVRKPQGTAAPLQAFEWPAIARATRQAYETLRGAVA